MTPRRSRRKRLFTLIRTARHAGTHDPAVRVSICEHPDWPRIRACLYVEVYGRDGGPDKPRHRIEARASALMGERELLALRIPCVECGAEIAPIRARLTSRRGVTGHLYFAATCPWPDRLDCSRGTAAREEYVRVREALAGVDDDGSPMARQGDLFAVM